MECDAINHLKLASRREKIADLLKDLDLCKAQLTTGRDLFQGSVASLALHKTSMHQQMFCFIEEVWRAGG